MAARRVVRGDRRRVPSAAGSGPSGPPWPRWGRAGGCSRAWCIRSGRARTGWLTTGADSLKARHLKSNPYTSLTYWDQTNEQVHVECRAEFEERPAEKRRVWNLFKDTPFPLGYDPALFFKEGPEGAVGGHRAAGPVAPRAVVARRPHVGEAVAGVEGMSDAYETERDPRGLAARMVDKA